MIKIKISKQLQWTIWIVLITITMAAMFWLVQPVKSASIFTDDFESGNLTAWDSSSGEDISASTASKKNGTYGMQVTDLTDATSDYVQDNLNNTEVYARVYIDPNSATLRTANNGEIVFLQLSDAGTQEYVLEAGIRKNATSGYDIRMIGQNDSSSWDVVSSYYNITDDWHLIEMRWKAGTGADGVATLWIDEVQKYTLTGRDTNNYTVDRIRLGTVRSLSLSDTGTIYWDDYASDDSSYIGPPVPTPTPTNTPTPSPTPATPIYLTTGASTIQIDVPNRYRAIMQTGDTTDYLLIYDRAQNNSTPPNTYEFMGPYIYEGAAAYMLSYHNSRKTTILESSSVRVRIRVEGCFDTAAGGACLTDGTTALAVTEDYTFTTEGIYVSNMTDFKTSGVALDTPGANENGYNFLMVDGDIQDNAFAGTLYYGDGATEGSTAVDATFEETNTYAAFPAVDASGYQSAIIGLPKAGWLDQAGGTEDWRIDVGYSGTIDRLHAREGNVTPTGLHYAKWYFLLQPENDLDAEAERESFNNDNYNPDILTYTTGSEWGDAPASPGIYFDGNTTADGDTHVRLPNDIYDSETDGTIEMWFKPKDTGDTYQMLFAASEGDNSYTDDIKLEYDINTDSIDLVIADNGVVIIDAYTSSVISQPTGWHHLVLVMQSTGHTLYIDGQTQALSYNTGSASIEAWFDNISEGTTVYSIGCFVGYSADTNDCNEAYMYEGMIDEVRIWDDARTAAEIRENMFKQISASEAGLIGYYRMNENTGTTAHDETTNNNDGILYNNAVFQTGYVPDHYNEAEGVYTLDFASNESGFDINGQTNVSTALNGAVAAGATSITVTSTTGFPLSGVAYIDGDKFSYASTTSTTFTGIPSSGELSIIGHATGTVVSSMNKHKPFFKMRGWRSNTLPSSVSLEGATLTSVTDYNLSYKPISDAYFSDELTWYSTLDNSTALSTPDVGATGGTTDGDFTTGKYGNGARFDADNENIAVTVAEGTDYEKEKGTIEFWFQPDWNSGDNLNHYMFNLRYDNSNYITLDKGDSNQLQWRYGQAGTEIEYTVTSTNYSWKAGDWVHFRLEWDDSEPLSTQQRMYINGVEPTHTDDVTDINSSLMTSPTSLIIGNVTASWTTEANGVIDEFRIYNSDDALTSLAAGGNTADSSEFLADTVDNYTLALVPVDASNRGEYVFFGADSMFSGVNVDLATNGATAGTLNLDWEYWNGTAWASLESISGFTDGTSQLTQDGAVYWTANPTNWRPYSVNGSTDLYYIRASLNASSGTYTTNPVENTIQTDILNLQYLSNTTANGQTFLCPVPITPTPVPTFPPGSFRMQGVKIEGIKID